MTAAFSSLRDLFLDGIYRPGLVVLLADGLADPPSNALTLAEKILPELEDVAPRTFLRYAEVVGEDVMAAIRDGFDAWKFERVNRAA